MPDGWPIRVSAVRSGREHDITCARHHDVMDSLADMRDDLPALTDLGYEGAGDTVRIPVKKPVTGSLTDDQKPSTSCSTAADIDAAQLVLAQLPKKYRRGRQTVVRTHSRGGTHEFVACLTKRGRWLSYSVGMTITDAIHAAVLRLPGAHPTRQPGHRQAHHQSDKPKRPAS